MTDELTANFGIPIEKKSMKQFEECNNCARLEEMCKGVKREGGCMFLWDIRKKLDEAKRGIFNP